MMHSPAPASDSLVPDIYRVTRVHRDLEDVVTLEMLPEGASRPTFLPGQFNMLYAFGVGEAAISISGETQGGEGFVHTVREVGPVSRAIAGLEAGARLGLRGPFGTAWPVAQAQGQDIVIIAGGLGLAPLRPAIEAVLANRNRYGKVAILAGCRTPESILYRQQLEQWRQLLDIEVEVTVDHAGTDWHGNVGVVPALISTVSFDPGNAMALVCGPEVMMRFTASALHEAGLLADRIYVSMERNMKCAVGLCGHCQFGPSFICKDGPVMRLDAISHILALREI